MVLTILPNAFATCRHRRNHGAPTWASPSITPGALAQMVSMVKGGGRATYLFCDLLNGRPGAKLLGGFDVAARGHHLDGPVPKIVIAGRIAGAKKSPGEVYVRKQHVMLIRKILREGITAERTRGHKHGTGQKIFGHLHQDVACS